MGYEVSLPSGTKMMVNMAPFSDANSLMKICAKELAEMKLSPFQTDFEWIKTILCTSFSSDLIEAAVWPCLRRCLYSGTKIDAGTFEGEDTRQDYLPAMAEAIKVNVSPFLKGLSSTWMVDTAKMMSGFLKSSSTPKTTN